MICRMECSNVFQYDSGTTPPNRNARVAKYAARIQAASNRTKRSLRLQGMMLFILLLIPPPPSKIPYCDDTEPLPTSFCANVYSFPGHILRRIPNRAFIYKLISGKKARIPLFLLLKNSIIPPKMQPRNIWACPFRKRA